MEFMKRLDTVTPEQVIAVPKISQERIPQRFVDRDWRRPQRAEQLVEVPTILVLSQAESWHSSSSHSWCHGGLQGFPPRQGSLKRAVEQIIDILVGGGHQDFLPDPGGSSSCSIA